MEYFLQLHVIDRSPEIPVDAARAGRLHAAREALIAALAIEEHFEIILGMYKALEKSAFSIAVEDVTHTGLPGYEAFFDDRVPLNVGVVSLLTAASLYLATLERHARTCLGTRTVKKDVEKLCNEQYDTHVEYRFMQQLRNHVQHHGLPIHSFSLGSSWDDDRKHREQHVSFFSTKDALRKNRKFKRKVLNELPERIDLQAATREYVDCLSRINVGVRALTASAVTAARAELQAALDEYRQVYGKDFVALHLFERNGDKVAPKTPILLKWDDNRVRLQRKNPSATGLRPAHVTTKIYEPKGRKRPAAKRKQS